LRVRRRWGLKTRAEWEALPVSEKDELLVDDWRRQKIVADMRAAISGNEHGPMDAAWICILALEQI
jgi:hypothetical protein